MPSAYNAFSLSTLISFHSERQGHIETSLFILIIEFENKQMVSLSEEKKNLINRRISRKKLRTDKL